MLSPGHPIEGDESLEKRGVLPKYGTHRLTSALLETETLQAYPGEEDVALEKRRGRISRGKCYPVFM
jgi:hypothetical protein